MTKDTILTPDEDEVINLLASAWNKYVQLKMLHPSDQEDFMRAIHSAQNIVMSRPVAREMYAKDEPMTKVGF